MEVLVLTVKTLQKVKPLELYVCLSKTKAWHLEAFCMKLKSFGTCGEDI